MRYHFESDYRDATPEQLKDLDAALKEEAKTADEAGFAT
jgi:hypothetical protein